MVPKLLGSSPQPKWKSTLIGTITTAVLLLWFYGFTTTAPETTLHDAIRKAPFLLILLVGLWMLWRGLRGLLRARRLRRNGIEMDAELLDLRQRTHLHRHDDASRDGVFRKGPSVSSTEYVDYAFEHDTEKTVVRDAPLLRGVGRTLGRLPDTVHIQVDPDDPGNSRLMVTPPHVTYVIRTIQVFAGCAAAIVAAVGFAERLF